MTKMLKTDRNQTRRLRFNSWVVEENFSTVNADVMAASLEKISAPGYNTFPLSRLCLVLPLCFATCRFAAALAWMVARSIVQAVCFFTGLLPIIARGVC
ncbi:MAG: hypothetical protein O3A23_08155 [Proteobacteria bacterium]|nr:hypothetical protein [Pseudomonadota bacterium]